MQRREVACGREVRGEKIGAAERRRKREGGNVIVIGVVARSRARVVAKLYNSVSVTKVCFMALIGGISGVHIRGIDS
jgi:hypothetical protein